MPGTAQRRPALYRSAGRLGQRDQLAGVVPGCRGSRVTASGIAMRLDDRVTSTAGPRPAGEVDGRPARPHRADAGGVDGGAGEVELEAARSSASGSGRSRELHPRSVHGLPPPAGHSGSPAKGLGTATGSGWHEQGSRTAPPPGRLRLITGYPALIPPLAKTRQPAARPAPAARPHSGCALFVSAPHTPSRRRPGRN